ncbi:pyridoxal phosphate-dependent aminotransferase [Candidatus Marinamargulisbacteria bacterium SCGC AAA071-K20]|nr:pyridoxal phosphate-dependent aminotransferase [Candidatus Marinamargulisbacteria bacterium SCGC AAA071-K20]
MKTPFSNTLDQLAPSGIRRFFDMILDSKDIVSLGIGEPDFSTPKSIINRVKKTLDEGRTSYTSNTGMIELREEIAKYMQKKLKCSYDPKDEVFITMGVSEGADLTLRAILNPGDEVIFPEPGYVCYPPLITLAGGKVVSVDTTKTNFIPTADIIKEKTTPNTKAIVLCTPNNPTGTVIPTNTLKEIAQLAKKHDFWVITDEIYAEIIFDNYQYDTIASFEGMKERTLVLSGFSKAFAMTGWRLGYICGPKEFIERALKIHQYSALCAPIMSQYAAIEALQNGLGDVERMRLAYEERRNLLIGGLRSIGIEVIKPEGAFYCFPSIKGTGLTSEEFSVKLLQQEKCAVIPGNGFGQAGEGYVRCCFASSNANIEEALIRIEKFYKSIKKGDTHA